MIFDWSGKSNSTATPAWPVVLSSLSVAPFGSGGPSAAEIHDETKIQVGRVEDATVAYTHIRIGG